MIIKYEIERNLANHLYLLKDYKIIIVCDDSGSMNTIIDETNRTRWDQLCYIVKIILEIGTIFDSNGVDIHFINRGSFFNLTNPKLINAIFSIRPCGYTPLVPVLRKIFKSSSNNQKKNLVFIATDGASTNNKGNVKVNELEHLMINGRQSETTHVMFLSCTDDQSCIDYLNEWDKNMINVDVTDNYEREKSKILSFRGPNYSFSIGDYIVKALIGAIHPQTDQINEP